MFAVVNTYIYIQWGKKVFSQPPIVQVLPLKNMRPVIFIIVRWSDGLVAEYRKALPFLDLTWSNRTLRSNLDRLATWERDADVKAKVRVAAQRNKTIDGLKEKAMQIL